MSSPVVGSGASHATNVREGMRRANEQREKWLNSLKKGEIDFKRVVEMSKMDQYKSLSTIRLADILVGRPGWTEPTALEAMEHQGFAPRDTIKSIRRSDKKVERFATLIHVDSDRWRPRPYMPEGWPWFGKLSSIVSQDSVETPDELAEFLGLEDDENIIEEESREYDPLAAFMGDEDDED